MLWFSMYTYREEYKSYFLHYMESPLETLRKSWCFKNRLQSMEQKRNAEAMSAPSLDLSGMWQGDLAGPLVVLLF